jgi:hypothetical protein
MLNELLRLSFRFANRRLNLIFFDLLWKFIWLALTLSGFVGVFVWFGSEFRSIQWVDTGNRALKTAIAVRILREFWVENWAAIFGAIVLVLVLSAILFFVLEAAFRSRLYSPPRRGGVAEGRGGQTGETPHSAELTTPSAPPAQPPLLCEEGNTAFFHSFLLSNVLKYLLLTSASVALGAICFAPFFAVPIAEWPQLWPDARGAAFISVVTIAALAFLLTIVDTLIRNDAVELLGADLLRVTALISILVSTEVMIVSACTVALGAGFLNIASFKSALGMLATTAIVAVLLNILHSYLLLVRYSAVDMMRQNVIEI